MKDKKQEESVYDDIFLFIPDKSEIIRIAEGSGDNLDEQDRADGYVDYVYFDLYDVTAGMPEKEGGEVLLKEMFRDRYPQGIDECIPDVLDMAYGQREIHYIQLQ